MQIKDLDATIIGVSEEMKEKLGSEGMLEILKEDNPMNTERNSPALLDDFEWPEFDQLCNKFKRIKEWPLLWETFAEYYEIQAYSIEALLNELRKEQLLELARQYSVNIKKSLKREIIIKSLVNIIPEQDGANILAIVNKFWKPMYVRAKWSFLRRSLSMQAYHSAVLNEYEDDETEIETEIRVKWWARLDDKVCSLCSSLHGKIFTEAELQKMMLPCPNCRCDLYTYRQQDNREDV